MMGIFDAQEREMIEAASERRAIAQGVNQNGLLLAAVNESLDGLHARLDALIGAQNELPAPEIEEKPEPEAPEIPSNSDHGMVGPFSISRASHIFTWVIDKKYTQANIEVGTSLGGHEVWYQVEPIGANFVQIDKIPFDSAPIIYVRLWFREGDDSEWSEEKTLDFEYATAVKARPVDIALPPAPQGRARLVFPDSPEMGQQDALPLKIYDDGTAELSMASQVTLSHEPTRQGAPVVESVPELVRQMEKRPPLILIKGTSMRYLTVNISQKMHDGKGEGVTVIEPMHDGACCPSFNLQDSSAFVIRGFSAQDAGWKLRANGACNSVVASGLRFTGKTGKTPIGFNPPKKSRGVMEDCVAQDIFADYETSDGYDEVMVMFGVSDIGWKGGNLAHAKNCGTINLKGRNRGDLTQWLAIHGFNLGDTPESSIDMEGCFNVGGVGVSTFSVGRKGGNNCPENPGLDGKNKSKNPKRPSLNIGNFGCGFGPSSSDQAVGTIDHMSDGYLKSGNHLFVAMPQGVVSSSYIDNSGTEMSHSHVCGGGGYAPWAELGFDDHVYDGDQAAFVNYLNEGARGLADMHSNTAFMHPNIGNGGGRMLEANEVRELMFKLPKEFGEVDSRMRESFKIYVPKGTKELVW